MSLLAEELEFWVCDNTDENNPIPIRQVFPANTELNIVHERYEQEIFFRYKVTEPLVFVNDKLTGIDDFDYLYDKEITSSCSGVLLLIKEYCDGLFVNHSYHRLQFEACEFDVSGCTITGPVEVVDEYTCVLKIMDDEVNLLKPKWPEKQIVRTTEGIYKMFIGHNSTNASVNQPLEPSEPDEFPEGPGWLMYSCKIFDNKPYGNDENYNVYRQTIWLREEMVFSTPPLSGGWVLDGDVYVRKPRSYVQVYDNDVRGVDEGREISFKPGYESGAQNLKRVLKSTYRHVYEPCILMDNGLKISDVLSMLLPCNNTANIISNYFNVNPDSTNPNDSAYEYAETYCKNTILYQKTDVIRPYTDLNASKFNITLGILLKELRMMDIYWKVENGKFRLEHYNYFRQSLKIWDIANSRSVEGKFKYTYLPGIPNSEIWKYTGNGTDRFNTPVIKYRNGCVSEVKNDYNSVQMVADFAATYEEGKERYYPDHIRKYIPKSNLIDNPINIPPGFENVQGDWLFPSTYPLIKYPVLWENELTTGDGDDDAYEGFVIGGFDYADDGSKYLINADIPGYFDNSSSSQRIINGGWSFSKMLIPVLRFNRFFNKAVIGDRNIDYTDVRGSRAIRKGVPIDLKICCTDPYKSEDLFKTPMGTGFIDKNNLQFPSRFLTVEIFYK